MLVATMHFLTPSGACKHTAHQSNPWARASAALRKSAEQQHRTQEDRSDSWEVEQGHMLSLTLTCNTKGMSEPFTQAQQSSLH